MKYIDADKIRTEIKRLKAENNCGTDEFIAAKDIAYDKVFDFLETLEEPVTDCHDLKEAAMNYIAPIENEDGLKVINFSGRDIKDAFIAGAEWGANHLRDTTKMMGDELEEIAENIYKVPFGTRAEDFKAGAEWQKKQFEKKES